MIQQLLPQLLPLNARKNRRRTILYVGIAAGSVAVFYVLNEIALLALLAVLSCIDRLANRFGKVP